MEREWSLPLVLRDLRAAREGLRPRLSLRELAADLGSSFQAMSFYETGRTPVPDDNEAFLRKWLRRVDLPEDRVRELLDAARDVRMHQVYAQFGATLDDHAVLQAALDRTRGRVRRLRRKGGRAAGGSGGRRGSPLRRTT